MLMRACVLHAVGDLRVESVERPRARSGWAVVRVAAAGVCGSDIPRVYEKGTYRFPLIPGHEIAGTVEEVADADAPVRPGERVAVYPLIAPTDDPYAEAGLGHLSEGYDYLGSRSDGGFAEYVAAPVRNLLPVPEGVSLEAASMTEPCAVALHALRRGRVEPGDAVWVVGAGPIGLVLVQWARAAGAQEVLVSDVDDAKLALAHAWPRVTTVNPSTADPVAWVLERTRGRGADLVIEAVGIAETIRQAILGARKRGTVVLMGNPASEVRLPQSDYWQILRRELTLVGTWNSSYGTFPKDEWRVTLEAMAGGRLDVEPLISHRVGLADAPAMLTRMRDRAEPYVKVIVTP